jgi:hypothetical protein
LRSLDPYHSSLSEFFHVRQHALDELETEKHVNMALDLVTLFVGALFEFGLTNNTIDLPPDSVEVLREFCSHHIDAVLIVGASIDVLVQRRIDGSGIDVLSANLRA